MNGTKLKARLAGAVALAATCAATALAVRGGLRAPTEEPTTTAPSTPPPVTAPPLDPVEPAPRCTGCFEPMESPPPPTPGSQQIEGPQRMDFMDLLPQARKLARTLDQAAEISYANISNAPGGLIDTGESPSRVKLTFQGRDAERRVDVEVKGRLLVASWTPGRRAAPHVLPTCKSADVLAAVSAPPSIATRAVLMSLDGDRWFVAPDRGRPNFVNSRTCAVLDVRAPGGRKARSASAGPTGPRPADGPNTVVDPWAKKPNNREPPPAATAPL